MNRSLQFNFSHLFDGVIWNMLSLPEQPVLILELRDAAKKETRFSALNFQRNEFLWKDLLLEEPWWINLSAVSNGVLLYTVYLETTNPDKKAVMAYNVQQHELLWWNNDFSLIAVEADRVIGFSLKLSRQVVLNLQTGAEEPKNTSESTSKPLYDLVRPTRYTDDLPHFETVKTFLSQRLNLLPVVSLEYAEFDSLIFISYNVMETALVNYLLVLTATGSILLHEKLDEPQKGIGLDTFFILKGSLFFVKNRRELVSYSIV